MKVLITGHKGFVGRAFCAHLASHEIVGVDIKDGLDCRDFFKTDEGGFDLVIHLAAIVGGRETIENNPIGVATDLSIDAEFFNWVVRTKPRKTVYFSSSAAYPIALQEKGKYVWLDERDISLSDIKNPDMTYGWAKLTGEYLAQYAAEQDCKIWVFRPFSGYGSDQDTCYPFPALIDRALRKEDPFVIWGDGLQTRDFIHIDDIVHAVLRITDRQYPMTVNLGTGRGTSFYLLAQIIFEIMDWHPEVDVQLDKPTGVFFRVADVRKLLRYYTPHTTLEEGIEMALMDREKSL